MGAQHLEAYGGSKLIINQIKGEYEVYHEDLIPYHHLAIQLATHLMASISTMCFASKTQRQTL